MSKNTTRKVRVVGTERYVNQATGEIQDFNVIDIEDRDANFNKLWLGHVLEAIQEIGNAKMQVLMHLLSQRNPGTNTVIATQREIAEATGVHPNTVKATLKSLAKHNIITPRKGIKGVVMLNPDVIFKGGRGNRLNVLLRYSEWKQMELPDVDPKADRIDEAEESAA